jgi:PIN domain nuclease of toxin-antitoxin system
MKVLIDTHTFLWLIEDHPHLSTAARSIFADSANEVFLSIASVWEMAIKVSLNKLQLNASFEHFITQNVPKNNVQLLPVTLPHLVQVSALPFHHRDPFDRLIIAQSIVENIPIVGVDAAFDAYPITRLW